MAATARAEAKDHEEQTEPSALGKIWTKLVENPLLASAAVAFIALVLLAVLKLTGAGIPKDSFRMEIAKALLEVGVVAFAAGLLKIVADEHRRRGESRIRNVESDKIELAYKEELLKQTLDRITMSYNKSKRARRRVRALGLNRTADGTRVALAHYDECMAEVNEAQLELETIKKDVDTNAPAIRSATKLAKELERMEKYLGAINQEYERERPIFNGKMENPALNNSLRRFGGFLDEMNGPKISFKDEYAEAHRAARKCINEDLIALTSAKNALKPA